MTNYFELLEVDLKASEWERFKAFRKKYAEAKSEETRHLLLSGVFILLNDRGKFLSPLIQGHEMRSGLREKYENLISLEERKARYLLSNEDGKIELNHVLWSYPWRKVAKGVLEFFVGEGISKGLIYGVLLTLFGGGLSIAGLFNNTAIFAIGLFLLLIGLISHQYGLRSYRIEALRELGDTWR